jgi:hemolysin III
MVAYILMGWLILVIFETFKNSIDPVGFWLLVAGGIAYSIGIFFYIKGHKKHFHTIWHLFVLAGSIFQFFAILLYVV